MKWKQKGNEYEIYSKKIKENFDKANKKIYIFGAGVKGEYVYRIMKWFNCFAMFIDNSTAKQATGKCSEKVISLNEYKEKYNDGLIVVAVDNRYISSVCTQLEKFGYRENANYYKYQEFLSKIFPILVLKEYGLLYSEMMQICLTERCTLKCRYCAHGCYNVNSESKDIAPEDIIESVDLFFKKIDKVMDFVLLGGEPFLYKDIDKIISHIGKNYRDQIHNFVITTNGTIVPSENVLELCKKYDVLIRISNYSAKISRLKERYEKLCLKLEQVGVNYDMGEEAYEWMDYGFSSLDRKATPEELIRVFDSCTTPCRELRNGRIYYCVQARSSGENLQFAVGQDDYLDLRNENDKAVILEYLTGYSEKGYMEMCNYCYGAEAEQHPIPVAEQL